MTAEEALGFFSGSPKLTEKLRLLSSIGLGYLRLGQSATTLSGGEAQRLKIAAELISGGDCPGKGLSPFLAGQTGTGTVTAGASPLMCSISWTNRPPAFM